MNYANVANFNCCLRETVGRKLNLAGRCFNWKVDGKVAIRSNAFIVLLLRSRVLSRGSCCESSGHYKGSIYQVSYDTSG